MFGQSGSGQPGAMNLHTSMFEVPGVNSIDIWVGLEGQVRINATAVLPGSTTAWVAGLQPGLFVQVVHPSLPPPPMNPPVATARAECASPGSSLTSYCCGVLSISR